MNQLVNINGTSCIYEIRNLVNNKIYIGSTNNLMYRRNYHLNHLRKGTHFNPILQTSWNKYGEENFEIDILMFCEPELLFYYEQQFLDLWNPEYNISKNAQVPTKRGSHLSKEHASNISKALIGKKMSDSAKINMSIGQKGKIYSEKTRKLWSKQRLEKPRHVKNHKGLISPDGIVFKEIVNLRKFCRENGLTSTKVYDMYKGLKLQHKGWTLYAGGE